MSETKAKQAPATDAADPNPKQREDKATPTPDKLRAERVEKTGEAQKDARAELIEKKRRWARSSCVCSTSSFDSSHPFTINVPFTWQCSMYCARVLTSARDR